jgi:hypothetical protein
VLARFLLPVFPPGFGVESQPLMNCCLLDEAAAANLTCSDAVGRVPTSCRYMRIPYSCAFPDDAPAAIGPSTGRAIGLMGLTADGDRLLLLPTRVSACGLVDARRRDRATDGAMGVTLQSRKHITLNL